MLLWGKLEIVGCQEKQPSVAFLEREGCLSRKRCPLSPAQAHCTNSNPRAAQGFWQRESLSSGNAEAAEGQISTSGPMAALLWHTVAGAACLQHSFLTAFLFKSWAEACRSKTGAKIIPPKSAVGSRFWFCLFFFYTPKALVLAQSKWRCMDKQKMTDIFAFKSKTWMSLH